MSFGAPADSAWPATAFLIWKAMSSAWWCSLERGRSSRLRFTAMPSS